MMEWDGRSRGGGEESLVKRWDRCNCAAPTHTHPSRTSHLPLLSKKRHTGDTQDGLRFTGREHQKGVKLRGVCAVAFGAHRALCMACSVVLCAGQALGGFSSFNACERLHHAYSYSSPRIFVVYITGYFLCDKASSFSLRRAKLTRITEEESC